MQLLFAFQLPCFLVVEIATELWQHLGIASLAYIFVFTSFVWVLLLPLKPRNWQWKRLLIFVSFCSPPAFLYAIPVQMIWDEPGFKTANEINLVFLGIVSIWRISLLFYYLKKVAELHLWESIVATYFPINLIIVILTFLKLDKVVFNIMMGVDRNSASPNDDIYMVLSNITGISILLLIPMLLLYSYEIAVSSRKRGI